MLKGFSEVLVGSKKLFMTSEKFLIFFAEVYDHPNSTPCYGGKEGRGPEGGGRRGGFRDTRKGDSNTERTKRRVHGDGTQITKQTTRIPNNKPNT